MHRPLTIIAFFLLLLHLWPGDRFPLLAPVYYLSPLPFIGLLFLPGLVQQLRRRRWLAALLLALLTLAPALWHYRMLLAPAPSPAPLPDATGEAQPLRIVFWTPDHYEFSDLEEAFFFLADFNADVIGLVEGNVDFGRQKVLAREYFPHQQMELLDHGMLLIHSGELLHREIHRVDGGRGALQRCTLRLRGREWQLALYDQDSNPFYSRGPSLREVAGLLPDRSVPLLLMGDFNLPHSAPSLSPLRQRLRPVFPELRGQNPYTWPAAFPFLAIDQVWYSPHFQPAEVHLLSTPLARHRLIRMSMVLTP